MNSLILLEIIACIILIGCIGLFKLFDKASKRSGIEYYRQIPGNLPVAAILYYYKGKMPNNALWITLLDFIQRGFYKLEKVNDVYILTWQREKLLNISDLNINEYEKQLLLFINTEIYHFGKEKAIPLDGLKYCMEHDPFYKKMANNFFYSLRRFLKQTYGLLPFNYISPLNMFFSFFIIYFFGILLYNVDILKIVGWAPFVLFYLSQTIANHKPSISNILITISFLIIQLLVGYNGVESLVLFLGVYPLLLMTNIAMLQAITVPRNDRQQRLYTEILGFRKFLEDLTRLYEKPIDYIPIYKQYYVLAVGLDVNLKSIDHQEALYDYDIGYQNLKADDIPALTTNDSIYQMEDIGLDLLFPGGSFGFNRLGKWFK